MKLLNWLVITVLALSASTLVAVSLCGCIQESDSKVICTILAEVIMLATLAVSVITSVYSLLHLPAKKITAASLAKGLHTVALVSLTVVVVVPAAHVLAPISLSGLMHVMAPEESTLSDGPALNEGELLTATATIMGLAVFGSALGTLGSNKHLIRGIAYTLIPLITVQAVFMLGLVGIFYFPVVVWIPLTAILLMLAVLAMVANKLLPDETDNDATGPTRG